MIGKPHILYTKVLSDHRRSLLEQMVEVSEVIALDPVTLPIADMPEVEEWVIVTSPHALESAQEYIQRGWGKDARWAAVGFRAKDKLEELGIEAEIKADNARALVDRLPKVGSALYLCGKDRTSTIEDFMGSYEWDLEILETYWTQPTHPQVDFNQYDAVVFFSPRNVSSVLKHNDWPSHKPAIAIGPTTAQALRDHGIEPMIVPDSPDVLLLTQQYLEQIENGTTE
ncbi:uroporphyrinogen-III synthase [Phaeocystidibacter luteus]|uniref:Uroporphyrinogen-III synthase n=1 Tax=Phaeocystidibacter luteus TaxID=911197 RepID=A0A6N6RJE0_9FLAO|nr:uroporphyrinogen-III synthase [Phaeocystidibacter luteus]KAB2807065.1 uroporphyrinogen-III synthase [Phaeocystidibacter luteus]